MALPFFFRCLGTGVFPIFPPQYLVKAFLFLFGLLEYKIRFFNHIYQVTHNTDGCIKNKIPFDT